jgi:hypothetical protein
MATSDTHRAFARFGHWLHDVSARFDPARPPATRGNLPGRCRVLSVAARRPRTLSRIRPTEEHMHGLIYLVGLIVVIMAILSLFGLR